MKKKKPTKKGKKSAKTKKSLVGIFKRFPKLHVTKLISKAKNNKKVVFFSFLPIIIILLLTLIGYNFFFSESQTEIQNPLQKFMTGGAVAGSGTPISAEDIKITPEFVSYLLQEVGVEKLHSNLLENPIINFEVEGKTFHSEIGKEIVSKEGLSDKADLKFNTNKQDIIKSLASEDKKAVFKNSVENGRTQVEIIAGKPELLSKGYLALYDSLK
jgi:hypothetical protein